MDELVALYKIDNTSNNIIKYLKSNNNVIYSEYGASPQLGAGYTIFTGQTREKLKDFELDLRFKSKTFYYVTNPYELVINSNQDEQNDNIITYSQMYFKGLQPLTQNNREFFALWETMMLLSLIPASKSIKSLHISSDDDSIRSLTYYRSKFSQQSKDDHIVISETATPSSRGKTITTIKSSLNDIKEIKTHASKISNIDFIVINPAHKIKKSERFEDEYREQESFKNTIVNVFVAISSQKQGGNLILKLYEAYTEPIIKIIALLSALYKNVYTYKPFSSRDIDTEYYLVCKNFNGIDAAPLKSFESIVEKCISSKLLISDIMEGYEIEQKFKESLVFSSRHISDTQFLAINKMVIYANSGNYYGEKYHEYLSEQKNGTELWLKSFFPLDSTKDKANLKNLTEGIVKNRLNNHEVEINKYRLDIAF
jgi:23S rRNA U2552 (ribose-2'-O)-methylase RlmE/FtsJ